MYKGVLIDMPEKDTLLLQRMRAVASTYMAAHRGANVLFWPGQVPAYMWCLYIHSVCIHVHIK